MSGTVQAPYSMRSILLLWERGHYVQALVLVRHLQESFVQVRYFQGHPAQLKSHWTARKRGERVSFFRMYEDASPGYYARQYGPLLSGVSHAGLAISVFSEWVQSAPGAPATMLPRLGCSYSERQAAAVMNLTLALLWGFLAWIPECFAEYRGAVDSTLESARVSLLEALEPFLNGVFKGELGPMIRSLVMLPTSAQSPTRSSE